MNLPSVSLIFPELSLWISEIEKKMLHLPEKEEKKNSHERD